MEQQDERAIAMGVAGRSRPRRSWTRTERQQIVDESHAQGADVAEVAQRHGMRLVLLQKWRRQHSSKAVSGKPRVKFAAVKFARPPQGMIEIDLSGGVVRVRGIVDAQMLREVLAAAR